MTAPIVFTDTETTGLGPDDEAWEFAAIRREPDGTELEFHMFIEHDTSKAEALPDSFRLDHKNRYDPRQAFDKTTAAKVIHHALRPNLTANSQLVRAHVVGAVPNFDTTHFTALYKHAGLTPNWHHHLIDVENLAAGYLTAYGTPVDLPWNSNELSQALGVEPPTIERHTAMGDTRWVRDLYDRITKGN